MNTVTTTTSLLDKFCDDIRYDAHCVRRKYGDAKKKVTDLFKEPATGLPLVVNYSEFRLLNPKGIPGVEIDVNIALAMLIRDLAEPLGHQAGWPDDLRKFAAWVAWAKTIIGV